MSNVGEFGVSIINVGPSRLLNINAWSWFASFYRLGHAVRAAGRLEIHCAEIDNTTIGRSRVGNFPDQVTTIEPEMKMRAIRNGKPWAYVDNIALV
jgi:hypothetical protein